MSILRPGSGPWMAGEWCRTASSDRPALHPQPRISTLYSVSQELLEMARRATREADGDRPCPIWQHVPQPQLVPNPASMAMVLTTCV